MDFIPRGVIDRRRWLMMQPCTLDGHPAKIVGARMDYATIRASLGFPLNIEAEFAWPTVERIIAKGGDFHS